MGLADLHIHSIYSWDGTATISAILKYTADHTDLHVIAITDHDEINGALEAVQLAPKYGIEVIPGSEISTKQGHLLALFIHKNIPSGLSLAETVKRVGDQNGICIAAHPGASFSYSLSAKSIVAARKDPDVARVLIGVETINASLVMKRSYGVAETIALRQGMTRVGSSDAHTLSLIGTAATVFPGKTGQDLRTALVNRNTFIHHPEIQRAGRILGHWARGFILRTAGWVAWNPYPESPVVLGKLSIIKQAQKSLKPNQIRSQV